MTSRRVAGSIRQPISQKFVPGDVLDLRQGITPQAHEGLVGVSRLKRVGHLSGCCARRKPDVDRLQDAAVERHQVRHKVHRRAELLFHLGDVPVTEDAVSRDRFVILTQKCVPASLAARPALKIPDFASITTSVRCINQAGLFPRQQRQQRSCRIAPGARDERRPFHIRAEVLH